MTDGHEAIWAYIDATRRCDYARSRPDAYDTHFALVRQLFEMQGLTVTPVPTYSSRRHCEMVELDGQAYLVHDQYLGQTFNVLNRFVIGRRAPVQAQIYAHKVLAEHFARRSFGYNALFCGSMYNQSKAEIAASATESQDERSHFIVAQEIFAMAHEAYHYILPRDAKLFEEALAQVRAYLSRMQAPFVEIATLDEARAQVMAFPIEHHAPDLSEEAVEKSAKELFEYAKDANAKRLHERRLARVRDNPALEEEMACDQLATFFAATALKQVMSLDVRRTIHAVYVGHHHLRWLRTIEAAINAYVARVKSGSPHQGDNVDWLDDEYIDVHLRSHYLIHHCRMVFETLKRDGLVGDEGGEQKSIFHELVEWQGVYHQHMDDPTLDVLGYLLQKDGISKELEERLGKHRKRSRDVAGENKRLMQAAEVLTGWNLPMG